MKSPLTGSGLAVRALVLLVLSAASGFGNDDLPTAGRWRGIAKLRRMGSVGAGAEVTSTAKVEAVIGLDGSTVIVIAGAPILWSGNSTIPNTLAGGFGLNAQGERSVSFLGAVSPYSGNKHFLKIELPRVIALDTVGKLPDGTSVLAGTSEQVIITLRLFQRDPRAP